MIGRPRQGGVVIGLPRQSPCSSERAGEPSPRAGRAERHHGTGRGGVEPEGASPWRPGEQEGTLPPPPYKTTQSNNQSAIQPIGQAQISQPQILLVHVDVRSCERSLRPLLDSQSVRVLQLGIELLHLPLSVLHQPPLLSLPQHHILQPLGLLYIQQDHKQLQNTHTH